MARIHPSAVVDPAARLADDVEVGPFAVVGPHVAIGPGTVIGPHAVVTGHTTLGARNRVFQFTSIGEIPQDRKYGGEPTRTSIGDDNVFREFVSIHAGTAQDRGVTSIGDGNLVPRLRPHRARLRRRQPDDLLEQRAARRPRRRRRLGRARGLRRRPPVLPPRRALDGRRRLDRAAGRSALRHRRRLSRQGGGHQQRGPAPARVHPGADPRGATRLQDRSTARGTRSTTRSSELADMARDEPVLAPLVAFLAVPGRGIVR